MKKRYKILILFALVAIFVLVYLPHLSYPLPFHVDEWHHISESMRMDNYGEYFDMMREDATRRFSGLEMGFHFFLFLISWVVNLVWAYQFFPAVWAVFSSLILFWVVYKKTNHNFFIAWLTMIFFASIRSNVNLTGLWFFTPLTFSIPFIFLYIYFFTEGIEKQNKKYILYSLAIMLFLVPTHSISVLFAIPILIIYLLINYKYLIKEYLFFLTLLLIPLTGILFFKYTLLIPWGELPSQLLQSLKFEYGWGVLEIHNSLTEVYHWVGYCLAIVGIIFVIVSKNRKKYEFYILWPIIVFMFVIVYKLTGVSFLSPYQRNLYYFALSLPLFSAIGLYFIIKTLKKYLYQIIGGNKQTKFIQKFATVVINFKIDEQYVKIIQMLVTTIVIGTISILTLILTFTNYYNLPPQVSLYHVVEKRHYQALEFMSFYPPTVVMATPFVSTAMYPISGHTPVGSVFFYGNKQDVEIFFINPDCNAKRQILAKHGAEYIISPVLITCDFELIYQENDHYIYKVNGNNEQ